MYGTVDLQLYLQICMHARIERLHAGYTAGTILAMSTGTIDTCSAAVPRYYLQYGSSSDVSVRLAAVAIGCGGTGTGTTDSISTGTGRRWAWSLLPQLASSTTAVDLGPSQLVPVGVDWSTTVASQQYLARSTAVDLAITGRRWLVYRYQLGSSTSVLLVLDLDLVPGTTGSQLEYRYGIASQILDTTCIRILAPCACDRSDYRQQIVPCDSSYRYYQYRVGRIMDRRSQHARMQNSDLISDSGLNRNFWHDAFRKKFSCMRGGGSQCIPLH